MSVYFHPQYRSFGSLVKSLISFRSWHALRTHALAQLDWEISRRHRMAVDDSGALPWLPYSCIHFLEQVVSAEARILEIGGGNSTLWWLNRGHKCVTIESDSKWAKMLHNKTGDYATQFKCVLVKDLELPNYLATLDKNYDIILNDGHGDRASIVPILIKRLSENGLLIWDNSDREGAKDVLEDLRNKGYHVLDFFGLGPINAYCSQTSVVFQKPIVPRGNPLKVKTIEY